MSKARRECREALAQKAATRLHAGETALDHALHQIGMLCAELPTMRQEAQLAATVGQEVFSAAARANAALVDARGFLVAAHEGLGALNGRLVLTALTAPGMDKPPPGTFASASLRAVA